MDYLIIDALHEYAPFAHSEEKTVLLRSEGIFIKEKVAALDIEVGRVIVDPLCTNDVCLGHFRGYGFLEMGFFNDRVIFSINVRKAVRGVILNRKGQVLLIKMKSDFLKQNQMGFSEFWLTPGGKVDPGEGYQEALLREVKEETGIVKVIVKEVLFEEEKTVVWNDFPVRLFNRYYLIHALDENIDQSFLLDYEKEAILDYKWWSKEELCATKEVVFPKNLGRMMTTDCG